MSRKIEIEFIEHAPEEIPALTISGQKGKEDANCSDFWLGWQLFGTE